VLGSPNARFEEHAEYNDASAKEVAVTATNLWSQTTGFMRTRTNCHDRNSKAMLRCAIDRSRIVELALC